MMRTWLNFRIAGFCPVQLVSGASENEIRKNQELPYQEPAQVPLGEKPQMWECKGAKGTRQIGPVTSEEGIPVVVSQDAIAGRSD